MFGVQKPLLSILWKDSPSSANLPLSPTESKESSPLDEEEIITKKRKMDDGVDISLVSEGTDLFVDL